MPSFSNDLYQNSDGDLNSLMASIQRAPATTTDTTTLTVAQLTTGVILATPTAAASYTLPTGALMDSTTGIYKVSSSIDFFIINQASSYDITMVAGSGFTLGGGSAVVSAGKSGAFRARRTGTSAWTVYRIWG
jgi:hypothetical protein